MERQSKTSIGKSVLSAQQLAPNLGMFGSKIFKKRYQ